MRSQVVTVGLAASIGALAPTFAFAQSIPSAGGERDWSVGVRASAYWDNNIPRSNKDLADSRGLAREDYVFTPSITANIVQPFGRQSAFLSGDAGYTFYRKNTQLGRRNAAITGGIATLLGPCRQVTYAGYNASQSDLANIDLGTTKNLREDTSVAAGLQCARPLGPGISVQVQRVEGKNSAPTLDESESTTETANIGLSYGRPSLGTFSVAFAHSNVEYPNRIIPGRPIGDGFFTQAYNLGYQRQFGSRLTFSGSAGFNHVKREFAPAGVDQSMNSAAYALDVLYGFGSRIDLQVRAQRAITPSQQPGKTYDQSTSADAQITYRAGSRLTVGAGYVWRHTESNVDTASSLLVVTDSRINAVTGSVSFKPNDLMSLQLNVRYEEREANLPEFTYSAARVGVSAQASF